MTTRDVVTPIANLIERLWPRDIAYPKRDQRAAPAIYPVAGAARSMDRPQLCRAEQSFGFLGWATRQPQRSRSSSQNDADARLGDLGASRVASRL
jgi:hypothetical protein